MGTLVEDEDRPWLNMSWDELPFYYQEVESIQDEEQRKAARAYLGRHDLVYLGAYICNRPDLLHPWLVARMREVEAAPDGFLDLWARDHYKSTIITFLKTLQDILNNPELTVAIFSHTQDIALGFLRQLKQEMERNVELQYLYDDVLWSNPTTQSPKWSEDDGITVKRRSNPKEATVEAWGIVKGQPTSRHFKLRVYDDLVTLGSVSNPEQIKATTDAFRLSDNLGSDGGAIRMIGTRYHLFDSYHELIKSKTIIPRIHAATADGSDDCTKAVFLTPEALAKKRRDQGTHIFNCQQLQNPRADASVGFQEGWLRWWHPVHYKNLSLCIIVDPASGKTRKANDYTTMWVLGRGGDDNWYVIDLVRDRLNLLARVKMLIYLHRTYSPKPGCVFYEQTGMNADIEALKHVMDQENYRFDVTPLTPTVKKGQRIERLIPFFEQGRIYLPPSIIRPDWEKKAVNVIDAFVQEEYLAYPVLVHDDGLDGLSNIADEEVLKRVPMPVAPKEPGQYALDQLKTLARKQRNKVVV